MATGPMLELLDCVVPPEWAAALAGASSTGHLQAALARPDLWIEFQLLEKLMYKNANQHRGAQHYQRLQEVRRLLGLLRALQLDRQVAALHEALAAAQQRGALPTGSMLMTYGGDQRRVPSHQAAVGVLHSLVAACHLTEQLAPAIQRASLQLLAQLAHSFFMPLCLTSLATLARIQVLAGQLMLDAVRAYNTLAEVAALLPLSTASGAAPAAAGQPTGAVSSVGGGGQAQLAAFGGQLPQLLRAQWRRGLAQLELVPCAAGDSLAEQAAAACARYAVHVVQAQPAAHAASAVVLEEVPAAAPLQQRQRGKRAAAAAPVLAVLEDRGVRISREAFAASASAGPPAMEAASAVAPAAPAAPAAAAAAAPAASTPDQAPASLLLGVVEDCDAPEEDASGTVASLMEGEARGHLYRRATMGLAPLGTTRPQKQQKVGGLALPAKRPLQAAGGAAAAPIAATAGVVAAATAAQQPQQAVPATTAMAEARPAAASAAPKPAFLSVAVAAPAAPKPAFLSVVAAAPAAPKPAFLSVVAAAPAAPKPAFLSVGATATKPAAAAPQPASTTASAAPPAPAATASVSAPAENQQPAAQAAAARMAQPAALSGAARKRKRAAAAAAAAAAEQQQQDEAAGPKSWQDWLQPLAGGAASTGGPQGPQQQQQQAPGNRRAWK